MFPGIDDIDNVDHETLFQICLQVLLHSMHSPISACKITFGIRSFELEWPLLTTLDSVKGLADELDEKATRVTSAISILCQSE